MELTRDDESTCQITLLLDQDWLDVQSANVGATVTMDLPEMSVCGDAIVMSIEPTEIQPGPGRLITGCFHHSSGDIHNLHIAGETEPIGVTASHPFWSIDRADRIGAGNLTNGETLKTLED